MGYDLSRFEGEVDEELICPICSGVLEDPLQTPICEHAFCGKCIQEWLSRQMTCPVDRQSVSLSQLKPVPRILRNLLSRLSIECDNASFGCKTIVKLDSLVSHCNECEFNPKKSVLCESGCGLIVPKAELKDHNCVRYLLQKQYNEVKRGVNMLKDILRATRVPNPNGIPTIVERFEQDEVERWSSSLSRARVTHWGGIISTPDAFQESVRKALIDSGCPLNIINELMDNSHERRWPPGLCTFGMRRRNRRLYDNYVCKRIPGCQAVVVMTWDNSHMSDDMLLEPGLVMIFGHGIE